MKQLLCSSLFILGLACLPLAQAGDTQSKASVYLGPKYAPDTYLGANTKAALTFTATDDAKAGGVELVHFFELDQKTLLLAQASGALGEEGFGILSGGLGVRRVLGDDQTFVGLNAFYDLLRDNNDDSVDFTYSQVGLGAELSRGRYTLRGNGYLPVGDRDETYTHGFILGSVEADTAWDAELEVALFEQARFIDPYVAVGYYGVTGNGAEYSGLKVRGEVRVGQYVNLGVEWRQDACGIDQDLRAGVRFEFPIGSAPEGSKKASDGKSFKKVLSPGEPTQFRAPVKRTPWPNGIVKDEQLRRND